METRTSLMGHLRGSTSPSPGNRPTTLHREARPRLAFQYVIVARAGLSPRSPRRMRLWRSANSWGADAPAKDRIRPKAALATRDQQQPPTSCGTYAGPGKGVGPPGISRPAGRSPPAPRTRNLPIIALISLVISLVFGPALHAQEVSVGLGTADDFAVLAGSAITNTGVTAITGDVGIHPAAAVTGFETVTLNGDLHLADAVAEQAKADLLAAYDDAANRTVTETIATELGGQTLTAGVYDSAAGTFAITVPLTLDAQNDPNAVFIFQMATTLGTTAASTVNLINGAQACNVFWQVGSSATLGADSTLVGNILALTSITVGAGATVDGRVLALDGAVTLANNTITRAVCAAAPEDTTTTIAPATTTIPDDTTTTLTPATTTTPDDTTTTIAPAITTIPGDATTIPAPGDTTATTSPGDTVTSEDTTATTAAVDATVSGEATASTATRVGTTTNLAAPVGGVDTGGGGGPGSPLILLLGGFLLLAVAVGAFTARRRLQQRPSS